MDSVNKLLSNYLKKSDFDDLLKRLEKCEKKAKKAKDGVKKLEKKNKKWKPKWKQMEKDIEELKGLVKNKVDYNIFDEEMERLKNLINQLSSSGGEIKQIVPTGPSISSKEMSEIRDAIKKVYEHDEKLR